MSVLDAFASMFEGVKDCMQWISRTWWAKVGLAAVAGWGMVSTVFGALSALLNGAVGVAEAADAMDSIQSVVPAMGDIAWVLGLANEIFPLQEGLYCIGLLLTAWGFSNAYRAVKSWLPTLS